MQDDFNSFLDSLDQEPTLTRATKGEGHKYPCGQCAGTGRYQGARLHQEKAHCFACRGKGYFTKSPDARAASKARREKRKEAKRDVKLQAILDFAKAHPDMHSELFAIHTCQKEARTEFLSSLTDQLFRKGFLSEGQINAWYRGRAKLEEARAARAEEQKKARVEVDLTPIREMFEKASDSGYKKPKYRAEGLVLSLAPSTGRNPGAIYVKDEDDNYLGKILGTTFSPSREGKEAGSVLLTIAQDPLEAALRYGQRTGRCACCGRELTKHTSIDLGIGPVCREKWGL